jgi:hypothetical protein
VIASPISLEQRQFSNVLNVLFRSGPLTLRIVQNPLEKIQSFDQCLSVKNGAIGDAMDCTTVAMDQVEIGGGTGPCKLDLSPGVTLDLQDGLHVLGPPLVIQSIMCEGQLR